MLDLVFTMDAEFTPELSRAAGRAVNELLSGETVVDHPCVMDKLAEQAEKTLLRRTDRRPGRA